MKTFYTNKNWINFVQNHEKISFIYDNYKIWFETNGKRIGTYFEFSKKSKTKIAFALVVREKLQIPVFWWFLQFPQLDFMNSLSYSQTKKYFMTG